MNAPLKSVESTALSTATDTPSYDVAPMRTPGNTALILDPQHMAQMVVVAQAMASAKVTVPAHLQGKAGDCLAIVMQAAQWGMNPFAVAQKTHVVNGTLGYEAQLVNAVLEVSGAIEGRFHYEHKGDANALQTRVGAIPQGESEVVWNEWLAASSVTTKNSPLWKTNQKQQMGYLQVKNWARAYKPGAILGVYTTDELAESPPRNMGAADVVAPVIPQALLTAARKAADGGRTTFNAYWKDLLLPERNLLAGEVEDFKHRAETADRSRTVENAATTTAAGGEAVQTQTSDPATEEMTEEKVLSMLDKATNPDALDVACDWIGEVKDTEARKRLSARYEERKAELTKE